MLIDKLFSPEQLAFCRALPKVELHAHLNGSIRESTMVELAQRLPGGSAKLPQLQQGALRSKACRPPAPPSRPPNAPSESIQQKPAAAGRPRCRHPRAARVLPSVRHNPCYHDPARGRHPHRARGA